MRDRIFVPTREKFCANGRRLARPDARHRRPGSSFFEIPHGRSRTTREHPPAAPGITSRYATELLPYPIELDGPHASRRLDRVLRLSSAKVLEHIDPECRREVRIDSLGVDLVHGFDSVKWLYPGNFLQSDPKTETLPDIVVFCSKLSSAR